MYGLAFQVKYNSTITDNFKNKFNKITNILRIRKQVVNTCQQL